MADEITAPATPATKPGWRTSEYWLTKAAMVLGALLVSGVLGTGTEAERIAGAAVAVLAQLGYTAARTIAKS